MRYRNYKAKQSPQEQDNPEVVLYFGERIIEYYKRINIQFEGGRKRGQSYMLR